MALPSDKYKALAQSMPVADEEVAKAAEQTRQIQLRAQLAQAKPGMTQAQMGQVAGQQAAQTGQAQVQQAARTAQAQTQVGGMGLQADAQAAQQALQERSLNLQKQANANANKLGAMSEEAKNTVLRDREAYNMSQANQQFMNQRTMADWAIKSARSKEDYQDTVQTVQQTYDRTLAVMEQAQKEMLQALNNEGAYKAMILDQDTRKDLQTTLDWYNKVIADKQADAANKAAMWQAGGTIIGAVVGGVVGGPMGAGTGAGVGGGLGSVAGGMAQNA